MTQIGKQQTKGGNNSLESQGLELGEKGGREKKGE
jgi:hypothetical protein